MPTLSLHLWLTFVILMHALSCKRYPGRFHRHPFINLLVRRALSKTGFPAIKEPNGLLRSNNKRPDGLAVIPWHDGRCATWDVTVTDTATLSCRLRPRQVKRWPNAKKRNISESPANIITSHYIWNIWSYQPDRDFSSAWDIEFHPILQTHVKHSFYWNAFLLHAIQRFNALCFAHLFGNVGWSAT